VLASMAKSFAPGACERTMDKRGLNSIIMLKIDINFNVTLQEDDMVMDLVARFGVKSWSYIARQLKGRLGKQCRERYKLYTYFRANDDFIESKVV
jgi:hypothetical protein